MKVFHLFRAQRLPISPDIAWAFFSNPANLEQLTPPQIDFVNESFERPKTVWPGLIQVYSMKLMGWLPCRWIAEITHVEAPHSFIDEQKAGPFAFWQHRHEILPAGDGVEIRDHVHYALPFGLLGSLIGEWLVKPEMLRQFDYRARMLDEFFGQ